MNIAASKMLKFSVITRLINASHNRDVKSRFYYYMELCIVR